MNDPNYTENFIQAILNSIPKEDGGATNATLIIGGDGRFYNLEIMDLIAKICAANKVAKLIFGLNGIISTPATSHLVRSLPGITGAIILTASHNPGGPENDIGIKYNLSNGAPAPESVTNQMYEESKSIEHYKIVKSLPTLDLSQLGSFSYDIQDPATSGSSSGSWKLDIEVLESTKYYTKYMETIFDFPKIKHFLSLNKDYFCFDALNGVTGPYAVDIFHNKLGVPLENLQNCIPKPDFGGLHPDPNLTYAHTLVAKVDGGKFPMGAASDGDGDRNMIYGFDTVNDKPTFISPGDSVAIISEYAQHLPYFVQNPIQGLARSFPTSSAIDNVAAKLGVSCYEVPTGWKFFCSLFDSDRLSICGEESFGTGSNHIREKDGLWAIIAWLNILAVYDELNSETGKKPTLFNVQKDFWLKYGRNFFTRYDYENIESEKASKIVDFLKEFTSSTTTSTVASPFEVAEMGDFEYKDIDNTVYSNQGLFVKFTNGLRIVLRLSGTGSQGSTIRLYVEKYSNDKEHLFDTVEEFLGDDIVKILEFLKFKEFIGTEVPTVKT